MTSGHDDASTRLTENLPALLEFAGFAGALIGQAVEGMTEVGNARDRIALIIKSGAFRPVFQPVVDIVSGAHVGYEALTRFADGSAPDLVFADARSAGLEAELEVATLAAAIAAARELPAGAWLSLNVSPSLVTTSRRLAGVLRKADRPVVLEVTEHASVDDYAAVRAAIARLRPPVRVAIDDAGSGVANFHHIVELRPSFVKLDMSLISGIDTDLTRQALVVGLLRFAAESGSQTIAEGVETEAELATLRRLGVPLVQGYLLARPAPVTEWVGRTASLVAAHPRDGAAVGRGTSADGHATASEVPETVKQTRTRATARRDTVRMAAKAAEQGGSHANTIATERDTIADARDPDGRR